MYKLYCGNNVQIMRDEIEDNSVDLILTSPPYDRLTSELKTIPNQQRTYKDGYSWDFVSVANECYRVLRPGGVMVWIVGDVTRDFTESCTPERQKLYFVDKLGFKVDTMIYHRESAYPPVDSRTGKYYRYANDFEYMYILSKGRYDTFNPICDRIGKYSGKKVTGTDRNADGTLRQIYTKGKRYKEKTIRSNIWHYSSGKGHSGDKYCHEHPASFPEPLALDHILSWTNKGDTILDPFVGSGTTLKMAVCNGRKAIGIDCSQEYIDLCRKRVESFRMPLFDSFSV